jgi:hypothetical protein
MALGSGATHIPRRLVIECRAGDRVFSRQAGPFPSRVTVPRESYDIIPTDSLHNFVMKEETILQIQKVSSVIQ